MKKDINKEELSKFNRYGNVFTVLLIVTIISCVPLTIFLKVYGMLIWVIISITTCIFAIKVEKLKKDNNIQTYKEIIVFTEGKRLDELESIQEQAKRPYQKFISALICGLITLVVCIALGVLLKPFA